MHWFSNNLIENGSKRIWIMWRLLDPDLHPHGEKVLKNESFAKKVAKQQGAVRIWSFYVLQYFKISFLVLKQIWFQIRIMGDLLVPDPNDTQCGSGNRIRLIAYTDPLYWYCKLVKRWLSHLYTVLCEQQLRHCCNATCCAMRMCRVILPPATGSPSLESHMTNVLQINSPNSLPFGYFCQTSVHKFVHPF